jgi:hypothetical protein
MERDVAVRVENHESQAWAACVGATGAVGGNPLGAAWLGFGATLPSHRGRGMQSATFARRISAAAEMGCDLVHTETTSSPTNPSFRNLLAAASSTSTTRTSTIRRRRRRESASVARWADAGQRASWVISTVTPRDSLAPPA